MPDFDIDFCVRTGASEVIRYVQERYGGDRVAQIITFGTLLAARRHARRRPRAGDALRPGRQAAQAGAAEPGQPGHPRKAIEDEPRLQASRRRGARSSSACWRSPRSSRGCYRHASTHAAGVVIGDRPLIELVPLYRDPKIGDAGHPVQHEVGRAGRPREVRLPRPEDADGAANAPSTCLRAARRRGRPRRPAARRPEDLRDARPRRDGRRVPGGKRRHAQGAASTWSADRFEDIIALVALYRPGPMANIPDYCARKNGREEPDGLVPAPEARADPRARPTASSSTRSR